MMRGMTDAKHLEVALHRLRGEIDALPLHDDETRHCLETLIGDIESSLDDPQTLGTDLNVFEKFEPKIPAAYTDSEYLFLANIDPVLQARVRAQMSNVRMVCGDTMNYWIKDHSANLAKVLRELDVLLINDGEARMLSGETNPVKAAQKVLSMGPKSLVVMISPC